VLSSNTYNPESCPFDACTDFLTYYNICSLEHWHHPQPCTLLGIEAICTIALAFEARFATCGVFKFQTIALIHGQLDTRISNGPFCFSREISTMRIGFIQDELTEREAWLAMEHSSMLTPPQPLPFYL
jgi:hypothetical protein